MKMHKDDVKKIFFELSEFLKNLFSNQENLKIEINQIKKENNNLIASLKMDVLNKFNSLQDLIKTKKITKNEISNMRNSFENLKDLSIETKKLYSEINNDFTEIKNRIKQYDLKDFELWSTRMIEQLLRENDELKKRVYQIELKFRKNTEE